MSIYALSKIKSLSEVLRRTLIDYFKPKGGVMDTLTGIVSILAVLSLSVERIVEMLKPFPGLNKLLTKKELEEDATPDKKEDYRKKEQIRRFFHHLIAVIVGAIVTGSAYSYLEPTLSDALNADISGWGNRIGISILMGIFASGGSGFWNSTLRSIEEFKNAKEELKNAIKEKKVKVVTR